MNAERALLGSLLSSSARWHDVELREEFFSTWEHRLIYRAIHALALQLKPIDVVTVGEHLESVGHFEKVGGFQELQQLAKEAGPNHRHYAKALRDKFTEGEAVKIAQKLEAAKGAPEAVNDALKELMALGQGGRDYSSRMSDALDAAWEEHNLAKNKGIVGIPSGLTDFDRRIGGFRKTMLIVVPARPAMGKTALLLNFALNANVPCGIISAEQDKSQLGARSLSIRGTVSADAFQRGNVEPLYQDRLAKADQDLRNRPIYINDKPGLNLTDLIRQAREWKHAHGIEILYVDYLQKIKETSRDKRHEQVGAVAAALKDLARELDIPVVSLAQVNREVEKHQMTAKETDEFVRMPSMGDIADSSEVEKEADVIATLYRPAVYVEREDWQDRAYLNVCKNRHGPIGMLRVVWFGEYNQFKNAQQGPLAGVRSVRG